MFGRYALFLTLAVATCQKIWVDFIGPVSKSTLEVPSFISQLFTSWHAHTLAWGLPKILSGNQTSFQGSKSWNGSWTIAAISCPHNSNTHDFFNFYALTRLQRSLEEIRDRIKSASNAVGAFRGKFKIPCQPQARWSTAACKVSLQTFKVAW